MSITNETKTKIEISDLLKGYNEEEFKSEVSLSKTQKFFKTVLTELMNTKDFKEKGSQGIDISLFYQMLEQRNFEMKHTPKSVIMHFVGITRALAKRDKDFKDTWKTEDKEKYGKSTTGKANSRLGFKVSSETLLVLDREKANL